MNKSTLKHSLFLAALSLAGMAQVAAAQRGAIEITPMVGYRFGGTTSTSGNTYIEKVNVSDAASFGLTLEYQLHQNATVEFLWSHQDTDLEVEYSRVPPSGASDRTTHLNIDTFQIGGLWQSGTNGDKIRGYFDLLLGATIFTPAPQYSTLTRFSWSVGGGAKFYFNDNIGARVGLRWMPVYINSSDSGYVYCDPYWGCYNYYNNNYLQQGDASVGVIIRF